MKTWILPVVMMAIAGVLVMGVLRPESAREVAAIPKSWIEARQTTALITRTRAEWGDVQRRSANGDAEAMYRLGTKMRTWSNEEWTGVETDFARGEELIRQAAGAGHLGARLAVWQIDGRDAAELMNISNKARVDGRDATGLDRLSDWLRWTALQECDIAMRDEATRLHQRFAPEETVGAVRTAAPDARSRYRSFMDTFERRCPAVRPVTDPPLRRRPDLP